jgi:hypothetical protein
LSYSSIGAKPLLRLLIPASRVLRKQQKEHQLQKIGFVSQKAQEAPAERSTFGTVPSQTNNPATGSSGFG